MASRNELNVRAAAVGFDGTTIPNDSKLEAKVLWLEKSVYPVAVTGTAPTTTLTASGVFSDGETLTLGTPTGTRVYTFKAALSATPTANEVLIGAAATNTLDNLKDAINGTSVSGAPGTIYGAPTSASQHYIAGTKTATTLVISARETNVSGGAVTTETCANAALTAATLTGGVLGSVAPNATASAGIAGLSGDRNTSL